MKDKPKPVCSYVTRHRRAVIERDGVQVFEPCSHPARLRKMGGVMIPACRCHEKRLRAHYHKKRLRKIKGELFR